MHHLFKPLVPDQTSMPLPQAAQGRGVPALSAPFIITASLQGFIQSWNEEAQALFGLEGAGARGKNLGAIIPFHLVSTTVEEVISGLENKKWNSEIVFTDQNGSVRHILHTITYLLDKKGKKTGVLVTGRNITPQPQTEEALLHSENFYKGLIADSLDGIILSDAEGKIAFASPSVKQILGYEPDELKGLPTLHFVHPEDRQMTARSFRQRPGIDGESKFIVTRLLKKNGEWLWCTLRGNNMLNNPDVNGLAVYFHDDSLRQEAIEALKESEQRFRKLILDIQIGILLLDGEGNTLISNAQVHRIFNISEATLTGKKIWELYPDAVKEDGSPLKKEDRPVFKALATKKAVRDAVVGITHPETGERIWILVTADPMLTSEGEVQTLICSYIDITERKKLEQKLIAEKLNHQRQLTQASIDSQERERREMGKELHDNIGQQLTTIKLFLDLAKSTADETTAEMVALALRNVSDVINEVRSISRSLVPSTLGDLGLVESIKDLVNTFNRTQPAQITFLSGFFQEDQLQENAKLMLFRIVQEQLNNIVKHAEASVVVIHLQNDSGELVLEITDDGKGFDEKKIKRGLGLTNMRNRAETLGGHFEISAAPGEGCTLKVTVPGS